MPRAVVATVVHIYMYELCTKYSYIRFCWQTSVHTSYEVQSEDKWFPLTPGTRDIGAPVARSPDSPPPRSVSKFARLSFFPLLFPPLPPPKNLLSRLPPSAPLVSSPPPSPISPLHAHNGFEKRIQSPARALGPHLGPPAALLPGRPQPDPSHGCRRPSGHCRSCPAADSRCQDD